MIIDISTYQGDVSAASFATLKSQGLERVIHKLGGSNSGTYVDKRYVGNVTRARQAGVPVGHYWFNGVGDPATDANFFVDHLSGFTSDDLLVIDVESEGSMPAWTPTKVLAFAVQVKARTGKTVMVYMSESVTNAANWDPVVAYGCPLWVAKYSSNAPKVGHWPTWSMWQHTDAGKYAGIVGGVDTSMVNPSIPTPAPTPLPILETVQEDDMPFFVRSQTSGQIALVAVPGVGVKIFSSMDDYTLEYNIHHYVGAQVSNGRDENGVARVGDWPAPADLGAVVGLDDGGWQSIISFYTPAPTTPATMDPEVIKEAVATAIGAGFTVPQKFTITGEASAS